MSELDLTYKTIGRQGTITLTIVAAGKTFTDKVDITKETARNSLLERIVQRLGKEVADALEGRVEEIATAVVEENAKKGREGNQADEIVALVAEAHLFHTPGGYDSEGYAAIEVGDHREAWPIGSKAFKRWLAKRYYDETGKSPSSSALDDALTIIGGKAVYDGPEHEVSVRLTGSGHAIFLDLGDPDWRVVEVTSADWRVISGKDAPVWFVRKRGMLALPVPVRGGTLDELRPLLNLQDETSWMLLVGCLVGYMRPTGPYPVLIVDGEQGSAKSTTCRFVTRIIDPRKAALRRPPQSERDLMIAASNSHLVAYDNLSGIQPWLSDTICSLATGGGFAARELYTDGDEMLFDAMRPVLMNGIDRVATRSDLLDRAVPLHLPSIPEDKRVQQSELDARFEAVLPRALGALLDSVVAARKNIATVKLDRLPRMADFAAWVVAAEPALGWKQGTFLAAYAGNRDDANEMAVEASVIGAPVLAMVKRQSTWEGTSKDLMEALEELADNRTREREEWPKSPEGVRHALHRIAPNLRSLGLVVEFPPRKARRRPIRIERGTYEPPSDGSAAGSDGREQGHRHTKYGSGDPTNAGCDGSDSCDGSAGTFQKDVHEWRS